jgi:type II secretion system protein N
MKKPKKRLLYLFYILVVTGLFLYFRFPADTLSGYLLFRAKNMFPGCEASIGSIKPTFPPGLKFKQIDLKWPNRQPVAIEQVVVSPGYLSLLGSQTTWFIKADTLGGILQGRINVSNGKPERTITADADIEGIALKKIDWLKLVSKRELSGTLGGKLIYNQRSTSEPLRADLTFTDLTIELLVPVFDMTSLAFKSVETDLVGNNQQVRINRCIIRGQKIDGNLSGVMSIKAPFEKSSFNLSGTLKIHPDFMAYLKKNLPGSLLPKKKSGSNGYPIRFFGTLDKPGFSLK